MDPNFVLRHDRKPKLYPECLLRRDPNLMPQFYFYTTEQMDANKFCLYFSQAVAASRDPNDQSVRVVNFLKRKHTSQSQDNDTNVHFVLDERAAKLYMSFVQKSADNSDLPLTLRAFDLDFDPVDHLGYRRIRMRSDCLYVVKPDPSVLVGMAICPSTGKLFGLYGIDGVGGRKVYAQLAEIEQPKANDTVLRAKLSEHEFEAENSSRSLGCRGMIFSKLNHLVIFYALTSQPQYNKLTFICSYDTNLNSVRCLAFDPIDLVSQFNILMDEMKDARKLALIRRGLLLVGRMHKYVLFFYLNHVLAVKWPKDWYTGKRLPPVQLCRVIDLKEFSLNEAPAVPIMLTSTHMYIVFALGDKKYETKRLALSPRFKDYRQCANCGEVEKGKRRNKEGKRVAQFKVCRLCKKKNFHLFYLEPENACHYCSIECVKQHWKIHKQVHKRSKLNRKNHSCKSVEIFD